MRDATSKALGQAILLDVSEIYDLVGLSGLRFFVKAKQKEITRSLTSLGSQIQGLSITAMSVNETLADSVATVSVRPDSTWDGSPYLLLRVLQWLGISPLWLALIFILSLPRYIVEQTVKALVWFGIKVWSVGRVSQVSRLSLSGFTDFGSTGTNSVPQSSSPFKHRSGEEDSKPCKVS